ncbi:chaperonin 10-like protein [Dichotomopilus funicola]|uniref:alcohol dehydrogenase n=1 Tax=Dichotomopilus funicola TaxID=1934379 RepID=A0AAN6ZJF0_9PEZI|nr:chaperonin 10-like protein [Dichotomopilus funicola]
MTEFDIPSEQWAQVIEKSGGPVVYKKIPVPRPGPDEVLLHIHFSGVCHTDLHTLQNDWPIPAPLPLVGGHEGVGTIVAKGDLVGTNDTGLRIGARAGVKWLNSSCLACAFCLAGDEPLCPRAQFSGYTVPGTFQQYTLAKAAHVTRIPDDDAEGRKLDLAALAPVLCAGVTVYKALKESGARPGQWVVVVGAGGGLGSMAVQYARAMGLRVVGIDGGKEKGDSCRKMGVEEYIDFTDYASDSEEGSKELQSPLSGPHAVLLLAVSPTPFRQAIQYVRSRGTIVCVGLPPNAELRAPVFETVVRMITIRGSYVGNRQDAQEALGFFLRGDIKVPVKTVGLSELGDVYRALGEGKVVGRCVVDTSR